MDNLLLKPEFYYWYMIPTCAGLLTLLWAVKMLLKKADAKNIIFTVVIFFLLGLSQWILVLIFFFDAWPSFFPHIATGISVVLTGVQYGVNLEEKKVN